MMTELDDVPTACLGQTALPPMTNGTSSSLRLLDADDDGAEWQRWQIVLPDPVAEPVGHVDAGMRI
jgi:hypothetical protein